MMNRIGLGGRLLHLARPLLRLGDVDVSRWSRSYEFQRGRYLRDLGVSVVVDVGANAGQYGAELRSAGYEGRLLSIEPQEAAYRRLASRCARDPLWRCLQCGLGAEAGEAVLKVSANSASSSILPILDLHVEAAPESRYERAERIRVRTLDSVVREWLEEAWPIGLKLDVQGYEDRVLNGGAGTLPAVAFLELELSLIPLYEGQILANRMIEYLGNRGFVLVNMTPEFSDPRNGRVLQFNGIFLRGRE